MVAICLATILAGPVLLVPKPMVGEVRKYRTVRDVVYELGGRRRSVTEGEATEKTLSLRPEGGYVVKLSIRPMRSVHDGRSGKPPAATSVAIHYEATGAIDEEFSSIDLRTSRPFTVAFSTVAVSKGGQWKLLFPRNGKAGAPAAVAAFTYLGRDVSGHRVSSLYTEQGRKLPISVTATYWVEPKSCQLRKMVARVKNFPLDGRAVFLGNGTITKTLLPGKER